MNPQLDSFYRECSRQGLRFAHALLRNRSDAEEAVQEAFFRLHKAGRHDDSALRGRFFSTLRNHCIDRIRRKRVCKEVGDYPAVIDKAAGDSVEFSELAREVQLMIDELPENWSRALLLKVHGELSYEEIASATECSVAQVRTWIYRARRQLEEKLTTAGFVEKPARYR